MKRHLYILALCAIFLSLAACSGTKGLAKPDLQMPPNYLSTHGPVTPDSLSVADLKWWEFYSDSTLSSLMRRALENNHDLLKAAARIEQMRQLYGVSIANILPTVGADVAYSYETNKYNGGDLKKDPEHDLKIPVRWELNLWGKMFHARNSARAEYIATIEDYRSMRMSLLSEIATAYIRLLTLENELKIVRQTLKTREEALNQAKLRFEGGLTPETVYQQAKVEYSTTASLVPDLELRVASTRNSLTLLMGEFPTDSLGKNDFIFQRDFDEQIPAGVPSDLLKRRPDLRASEQRLRGALSEVGVAYADRFPSLTIGFTPGFENDGLKDFFISPFTYTLAQITGSVFDFGRKKRKYKASIAAYEQSRIDYEKNVTEAFTEVSTAVTAYAKYRENFRVKSDLRDAAAKYVQLAWLQYRGGTLNYIEVLDAQRRYFEAQIGVNNALRDKYLALVNIYKSLGGGWETDDANL